MNGTENSAELIRELDKFYKGTKSLHWISLFLIPALAVLAFFIPIFIGSTRSPVENQGLFLFILYFGCIAGLCGGAISPKIFGDRNYPDLIIGLQKTYGYHVAQLSSNTILIVLVSSLLSLLGYNWWTVVPTILFSTITLILTFPSRRKWEIWTTGY